ncbi:MAG: hypothetical protein EPN93_21550 [Spirochaetes bacterium]|nr:MAG: hypothetical protein EPN93_21550 [Spirochaetota bacterium]
MSKHLRLPLLILVLTLIGSASAMGAVKTIYIKPFTVTGEAGAAGFGAPALGATLGNDVRDYMSEEIVKDAAYILTSDDEVKKVAEQAALRMTVEGCADDECIKELMKAIDADLIIFGSVKKGKESITISAKLLERVRSDDKSYIRIKSSKVLTVQRERYVENASKALAQYLLGAKDSTIKDFNKYVARKEREIRKSRERHESNLNSIEDDYESRWACLRNSPLLRVGYGGFSVGGFNTVSTFDKTLNDYYTGSQMFFADLFIYRSKDIVGDGVDIYARVFQRKFTADSSAYGKIQAQTGDFDDTLGKYDPIPQSGLQIMNQGADLGMRFVGSTYFFNQAWSAYLSFAFRIMKVEESYKSGGVTYEKDLMGRGLVGGIGIEVTLNRYLGLFTELSAGYTATGGDKKNLDGRQILFGVTLRTDHVSGSFLGL